MKKSNCRHLKSIVTDLYFIDSGIACRKTKKSIRNTGKIEKLLENNVTIRSDCFPKIKVSVKSIVSKKESTYETP